MYLCKLFFNSEILKSVTFTNDFQRNAVVHRYVKTDIIQYCLGKCSDARDLQCFNVFILENSEFSYSRSIISQKLFLRRVWNEIESIVLWRTVCSNRVCYIYTNAFASTIVIWFRDNDPRSIWYLLLYHSIFGQIQFKSRTIRSFSC